MAHVTLNGIKLSTLNAVSGGIDIPDLSGPAVDLHIDTGSTSAWGSAIVGVEISLDGGDTWATPTTAITWSAPGVRFLDITNCKMRLTVTQASGGSDDFAQAIIRVSPGVLSV